MVTTDCTTEQAVKTILLDFTTCTDNCFYVEGHIAVPLNEHVLDWLHGVNDLCRSIYALQKEVPSLAEAGIYEISFEVPDEISSQARWAGSEFRYDWIVLEVSFALSTGLPYANFKASSHLVEAGTASIPLCCLLTGELDEEPEIADWREDGDETPSVRLA